MNNATSSIDVGTPEWTGGRTMQTIEAALTAPLKRVGIKQRAKGGIMLDYVEAWACIAEANRIFGHNGWSRKTIFCEETCRYEKESGNKKLHVVGYIAKVEITALGITREGTGNGDGQAVELFAAIESAAKEAESDAMKRALMTFGNPFGLALYDKTKEGVEGKAAFTNAALRNKFCDNVIKSFSDAQTLAELNELATLNKLKFTEMDEGSEHDVLGVDELRKRYAMAKIRITESKDEQYRLQQMHKQLGDVE